MLTNKQKIDFLNEILTELNSGEYDKEIREFAMTEYIEQETDTIDFFLQFCIEQLTLDLHRIK